MVAIRPDAPPDAPYDEVLRELRARASALWGKKRAGATMVNQRTNRYHPFNTIDTLANRAVTFACLVFGGVMDKCPNLKVCLAHGGGYVCFGWPVSWVLGLESLTPEEKEAILWKDPERLLSIC